MSYIFEKWWCNYSYRLIDKWDKQINISYHPHPHCYYHCPLCSRHHLHCHLCRRHQPRRRHHLHYHFLASDWSISFHKFLGRPSIRYQLCMLWRIPLISFSSFCTFPDKMLSRLTSNVVCEIVVNPFQGCFILFIIVIINIPFQNYNFASGHIVFLQQRCFITLLWQNLKWYNIIGPVLTIVLNHMVDSRYAPSQWEMSLQNNTVSHWLGTNLESALNHMIYQGKSHLSCEMQFWEDTKPWHVLTRQAADVSG